MSFSFEVAVDIFDYLDTLVNLEKRSKLSMIIEQKHAELKLNLIQTK